MRSESEAYLQKLAERTFLKLWAIPNPFRAPSKELTDLIVPFGDDLVIFSDKACRFDIAIHPELAWSRWYTRAIEDSVRQLKGAAQRIEREPEKIYLDSLALARLPKPLVRGGPRRIYLVAIARPDPTPDVVPDNWPGLTHVSTAAPGLFEVGKLQAAGRVVHVFDGPSIDLILGTLDTAPDFIAYLDGRERRIKESNNYSFREEDLLAAALISWQQSAAILPSPPPLETVAPGIWADLEASGNLEQRVAADAPSRVIDALIEHQHNEYVADRFLGKRPGFPEHEATLRMLATECRFARRMIAHELHDILNEEDQTTFWAATVSSPTQPSLRFLWLIYPARPPGWSDADADRVVLDQLKKYVLATQGLFEETLVLGTALPGRMSSDTAIYMVLHDKAMWAEADREAARSLKQTGIMDRLEAQQRLHFRFGPARSRREDT